MSVLAMLLRSIDAEREDRIVTAGRVRVLAILALVVTACAEPQVPQIPDVIEAASLGLPVESLLVFEGVGVGASGVTVAGDGTLWVSLVDRPGPAMNESIGNPGEAVPQTSAATSTRVPPTTVATSSREERTGWLVEVTPAREVIRHGPFPTFSDDLIVDDAGHVWLADRSGVWRFDGSDLVLSTDALHHLGPVTAVASGPDNSIWAITESASLLRYQGDAWQTFAGPEDFTCGLSDCIAALAIDGSGTAWVGLDIVGGFGGASMAMAQPWLLRFDGEWSTMTRSDSPLTGAVKDIAAANDGALWVLFDLEMVPTNEDPLEWCSSHVSHASGIYPAFCSGGLADLRAGNWTVLDNYIPGGDSVAVSTAGAGYVWFEPDGRRALRVVQEGGVSQYHISLNEPVFSGDQVATVGSSVWIIERRSHDDDRIGDVPSEVYLTRYELGKTGND